MSEVETADGKLARAKISEAVVDHLLREFAEGRLRPGDRIDPISVADDLGISRAPVREALVLLERDGTVRMPYHRGAYLGDIGEGTIREAFALYALLSGLTARLAAIHADDATRAAIGRAGAAASAATVAMEFELQAREVRRLVNRAAAGPHLRAMLRTFTGLVVAVSAVSIEADLTEEQHLLDTELTALAARDADVAAAAAVHHVRATGERGITVLRERGAISGTTSDRAAATRLPGIESLLAGVLTGPTVEGASS